MRSSSVSFDFTVYFFDAFYVGFENRGFQLLALKMMSPSQSHLEEHYKDLAKKAFFPGLIKYMGSGPIVGMVNKHENIYIKIPGLARKECGQDWSHDVGRH